jgi:sortase B
MSWKKYLDYNFENDINESEREARERAVDDDMQKIRSLIDGCDMKSSKDVTNLYLLVRDHKIGFRAEKTRENFMRYLAETAAVNRTEEAERNRKANKRLNARKLLYTLVGVVLIGVAVAMLAFNIYNRNRQLEEEDTMNSLAQQHREIESTTAQTGADEEGSDEDSANAGENEDGEAPAQKQINAELESMYAQNQDLAGWLTIEGAGIDYPVLKGTDNDYYLEHDFYGNATASGSIFMDYRNSDDDINIIIYGHNMSGGLMFGNLSNYRYESFYNAHKEIKFDTLYEHYTYEIIAVCLGRVRYIDEEGFRYYNYTNDEYELDSFFMDMRNQSIYPVDHEFENSDRFITLSTCSNDSEDGRLYVVAVRKS